MSVFRKAFLGASLIASVAAFSATAFAESEEPVPAKKCDASGKVCQEGPNCKPENCK